MSGIVQKYEMEYIGKEKSGPIVDGLCMYLPDNEALYLKEYLARKTAGCLQNRVAMMAVIKACELKNAHARGQKIKNFEEAEELTSQNSTFCEITS